VGLINEKSQAMKLDRLHWLLIVLLLATAVFVWFTPYRYERWQSGGLVRINRITGDTDILLRTGWRPMVAAKTPIQTQGWTVDEVPNPGDTK